MLYNIRRKFQEHVRGLEHTIVDNNFYDLLTNVLFCRSINYGDTYTGRIQLFVSDDEGKCSCPWEEISVIPRENGLYISMYQTGYTNRNKWTFLYK